MARVLDRMCRRYSQRPSQILFTPDDDAAQALDFDLAMAMVHEREETSRLESLAQNGNDTANAFLAMR